MAFHNAATPEDVPDSGETPDFAYCVNCDRAFWPQDSDALDRERFCDHACEAEDAAAEIEWQKERA